jgi:hypothetical protein
MSLTELYELDFAHMTTSFYIKEQSAYHTFVNIDLLTLLDI